MFVEMDDRRGEQSIEQWVIDNALRELWNSFVTHVFEICLLYTSPSPRDRTRSRMPSSA